MKGLAYIKDGLLYVFPVLAGGALAFLSAKSEGAAALGVIGLALAVVVLYLMAKGERTGYVILLLATYFSTGLTRYVPLPLGLSVDVLLLLIFLLFFFQNFQSVPWGNLKNPIFIAVSGWMMWNVLQIFNPEARSIEAWFYAMRGVALYFFLTLMVAYLMLDKHKDLPKFIFMWGLLGIIGTVWGMKQLMIGLDPFEQKWLSEPGNLSTHLLFGKLRVFSFYSDAGQFGASQAHMGIVAALLAVNESKWLPKILLGIVALLGIYGMLISGTRGAFAIPVVAMMTYLFLVKNWKAIILAGIVMGSVFFFLKFTFIAQDVYEIRRLRTALDPNDPSLQVRIENQKKLSVYLDSHPLGGGVGSGGYWGQRFSPGTFLANLALDSWYVKIAAEYGYVGLTLYLFMLIFIMINGYIGILRAKNDYHRGQLIAIFSGLAGILVASYGNQVFGQLPTGILVYLSIFFLTPTYKKHILLPLYAPRETT